MSAKKKDTKSKDGEEEGVAYDAYASEKNKGKIMAIAALRFRYSLTPTPQLKEQLMVAIKENNMAPFYESLCKEFGWTVDTALLSNMSAVNVKAVAELESKAKDAEENQGESEILDAALETAEHYYRIGDQTAAIKAYETAAKKAISTGQKIDVTLQLVLCGFLFSNEKIIKTNLEKANSLCEEGGDWDRRNRLRVYEGTFALMSRDFKLASLRLLETVATFTCYELHSHADFVFYAVISSMLSLDRPTLREKVVQAPDVLSVIAETPNLKEFVSSLSDCKYRGFFEAMVELYPAMQANRFLYKYCDFAIREFRVLAYNQYLTSYKSVKMATMASSFGVSVEFLDKELSRFISVKRVAAKIDKVDGIIEANRPDTKNAQYQDIIKHGDLLLNQIQKLARVVSV